MPPDHVGTLRGSRHYQALLWLHGRSPSLWSSLTVPQGPPTKLWVLGRAFLAAPSQGPHEGPPGGVLHPEASLPVKAGDARTHVPYLTPTPGFMGIFSYQTP